MAQAAHPYSAPEAVEPSDLPAIIDRAGRAVADAKTHAEILAAGEQAEQAYDAARRAARLARARHAHDEVLGAAKRLQGSAVEIISAAAIRLADEYDAAQDRGEVAKLGTNQKEVGVPVGNTLPTAADLGLSRKQIHEARSIRDADKAVPGIVPMAVQELLSEGAEPTKAAVGRKVEQIVTEREAIQHAASAPRANRAPPPPRSQPEARTHQGVGQAMLRIQGALWTIVREAQPYTAETLAAYLTEDDPAGGDSFPDDAQAALRIINSILKQVLQ